MVAPKKNQFRKNLFTNSVKLRTSPLPIEPSIDMKSSRLCDVEMPLSLDGMIQGYGGGGFIHVPSGFFICLLSEANVWRNCPAGITRKNLFYRYYAVIPRGVN